jgi:regulatory protein
MIVKAVVPVDKRKCKVFLEGDFAFVLYKSEAARFHIEEGNDLPAKTYEMIEEGILLKRARDRALYLLQSQGRTQAEMIKKLKDDGYSQSVTERVLSFLQEYHFIDDNAYTENYIHVNKGRKSKRQITYELQQKGVDRDQIRQMLEENPVDEEETVRALLKKKTGGRIPEDKKEIQKLAAFLGRKGFSFEVISRVLRDVADY